MSFMTGLLSCGFINHDKSLADNGDHLPETKKCIKCLRRIDLHYLRCPHCNNDIFHYNDM